MEKYLVIRDYLRENITPTVAGRFADYDTAKEFVKFLIFEQSK